MRLSGKIDHQGKQLSWKISSDPLYHAQPISRWKSSVHDLQVERRSFASDLDLPFRGNNVDFQIWFSRQRRDGEYVQISGVNRTSWFLGCPSVLYEDDLVSVFSNSLVKDNEVLSCVQGKFVVITEDRFVGVFELPTEGLTDLSDVPKDLIYDARSIFSMSVEPVNSCKKREMKYEFCLLNDILAKSVTVKAGSFDDVMHERFLLMTAIHFGVKVNWSKLLFDILNEMADQSSKRAKVYVAQICVLLKSDPNLTLGEAKTFPPLEILTVNTVGTYVAKNKNITDDETNEPVAAKAAVVKKKTVSKKRPAATADEPILKKMKTTVGRAAPAEKGLVMVPVVQNPEPISVVPAATPRAHRRQAPKMKLVMQEGSDDEIVDNIIHQVIKETAEIETGEPYLEEPVVTETTETAAVETESRIDVSSITNFDEEKPVVDTETEKEKEAEKEKEIELVAAEGMSLEKTTDSEDTEPLSKVMQCTVKSTSDEESIPIDDLLAMIPADMMLPSVTAEEPKRIKFGLGIEIPGVNDGDWYKFSLPQIAIADKGKVPLVEKD
ncbi:hypothetical protein F511_35160 [Dorcoceras hygrometricum]|uniref:Splicing factor 3B subunit 1-like n=1 Tax=Dorcoceras hygrometricum TaxID=472368 RepID=A0A2Z7C2G2_9LAMI|nr:hypothetical protein F511_35160 [Dorcoceras hygrometricum]